MGSVTTGPFLCGMACPLTTSMAHTKMPGLLRDRASTFGGRVEIRMCAVANTDRR